MSKNNPAISIIIPVHNDEEFLPFLLDDLDDQTFSNFEMIFVDDGSNDNSANILKSAASKDRRITVVPGPNKGDSAARNAGMDVARGEYLLFWDGKDMCEPNAIEQLYNAFSEDPEIDLVFCDLYEYIESNQIYRDTPWAVDKDIPKQEPFVPSEIESLFEHICGYPWNKMFRKSLLEKHDLRWQEGLSIHDDMSLSQSALALANKAYYINKPLYHHRRPDDSGHSQDIDKRLYEGLFAALEGIKDTLKRTDAFEKYKHTYVNYALQQSHWKYNAINDELKPGMADALRHTWFEKLEISGHPDDYFTNPADLEFMKDVMNGKLP